MISILFFILSFFITRAYFSEAVQMYTANRAKLQVSILINDAISKEVVPNIVTEDLMIFRTNTDGHVTDVIIDVYQINNVTTKMAKDIQQSLKREVMEEHLRMPIGALTGHPMWSNLGPKIDIEIQMLGNVMTDIVTKTEPYGINNTLMKVMIKTEVQVLVLIPFQRQVITVTNYTPLVIKMIQGEVPQYYYNSSNGEFIPPPRENFLD